MRSRTPQSSGRPMISTSRNRYGQVRRILPELPGVIEFAVTYAGSPATEAFGGLNAIDGVGEGLNDGPHPKETSRHSATPYVWRVRLPWSESRHINLPGCAACAPR